MEKLLPPCPAANRMHIPGSIARSFSTKLEVIPNKYDPQGGYRSTTLFSIRFSLFENLLSKCIPEKIAHLEEGRTVQPFS